MAVSPLCNGGRSRGSRHDGPARRSKPAPAAVGGACIDGTPWPPDAKRFVYVLQSVSQPDRQFVESAANVSMRVATHNAGHSPLTASCRPWRLVAVVQFGTEGSTLPLREVSEDQPGRALARQYFAREEPA